ncbi:MAG: FAD-binding oxidoreductase [Armatimonadota bacterium]
MSDALAAIVGAEGLLTGAETASFAVNGAVPPVVVLPRDRDQVAAVVSHARESGQSIVPFGGGTRIEQGRAPSRLDLVLCTRKLHRVVDYQPDDMTVAVEAGVTLKDLQEVLAERSQFLPLNPALPGEATVGGIVASAASGPWRAGYGTPRDWVIGCRVVDSEGRLVRGGGQVVKNVAGYDLPKLYTGSFGTLGVLVEVTFKVLPRPPATGFARVVGLTAAGAETVAAAVMDSDLQPSAMELYQPEGSRDGKEWALLLQFMSSPEAVEWQLGHLERLAQAGEVERLEESAGEAVLAHLRDLPSRGWLRARISTLSSRVASLAAAAVSLSREQGWTAEVGGHAATGQVLVVSGDATSEAAVALRELAQRAEARCLFERLPADAREIDPWGEPGPDAAIMRGVKAALDPTNTFSPGRFYGGI